jgi:hypothetical protein
MMVAFGFGQRHTHGKGSSDIFTTTSLAQKGDELWNQRYIISVASS